MKMIAQLFGKRIDIAFCANCFSPRASRARTRVRGDFFPLPNNARIYVYVYTPNQHTRTRLCTCIRETEWKATHAENPAGEGVYIRIHRESRSESSFRRGEARERERANIAVAPHSINRGGREERHIYIVRPSPRDGDIGIYRRDADACALLRGFPPTK